MFPIYDANHPVMISVVRPREASVSARIRTRRRQRLSTATGTVLACASASTCTASARWSAGAPDLVSDVSEICWSADPVRMPSSIGYVSTAHWQRFTVHERAALEDSLSARRLRRRSIFSVKRGERPGADHGQTATHTAQP